MGILGLFNKQEPLVCVDVGSTGVKIIELDLSGDKPRLMNVATEATAADVFSSYLISKPEQMAEQLSALFEANSLGDKRTVVAVPAPSVFTKRVKMPEMPYEELKGNIEFEAGNLIPHPLEQVRLDFHVVGRTGKSQVEVLIVAVKNEIIDSFIDSLGMAGLDIAVVDVDYFALQNMFELGYPESHDKLVALLNVGARYSSISICRGGKSLFTGDIAVGGKMFTDAIMQDLSLPFDQAEAMKRKGEGHPNLRETLDRTVEYAAAEFNRQLSFFWNASGADDGIQEIWVTGGGAMVAGLVDELSEKTGIVCRILDPLRGIEVGEGIDPLYLREIGPTLGIAIGLGLRQPGDKIVPEL